MFSSSYTGLRRSICYFARVLLIALYLSIAFSIASPFSLVKNPTAFPYDNLLSVVCTMGSGFALLLLALLAGILSPSCCFHAAAVQPSTNAGVFFLFTHRRLLYWLSPPLLPLLIAVVFICLYERRDARDRSSKRTGYDRAKSRQMTKAINAALRRFQNSVDSLCVEKRINPALSAYLTWQCSGFLAAVTLIGLLVMGETPIGIVGILSKVVMAAVVSTVPWIIRLCIDLFYLDSPSHPLHDSVAPLAFRAACHRLINLVAVDAIAWIIAAGKVKITVYFLAVALVALLPLGAYVWFRCGDGWDRTQRMLRSTSVKIRDHVSPILQLLKGQSRMSRAYLLLSGCALFNLVYSWAVLQSAVSAILPLVVYAGFLCLLSEKLSANPSLAMAAGPAENSTTFAATSNATTSNGRFGFSSNSGSSSNSSGGKQIKVGNLHFSRQALTKYAGTVIIASMLRAMDINDRTGRLRKVTHARPQGWVTYSDEDILVAAMLSICIGESTFCGTEELLNLQDRLGFKKGIPAQETIRQRLSQMAEIGVEHVIEQLNFELLRTYDLELSLTHGFLPMDVDVTPMDNSKTQKEGVELTYKKFFGYSPMMVYFGKYLLDMDFRRGSDHSQVGGTTEFFCQAIRQGKKLKALKGYADVPILVRMDSGNDSSENFYAFMQEGVFFICSHNRRNQDPAKFFEERMEANLYALKQHPREGKIVLIGSDWLHPDKDSKNSEKPKIRRVFYAIKRMTTANQIVLDEPSYELKELWTNTSLSDEEVIEAYCEHATCERYHSEYKNRFGEHMERFPSGEFTTNNLYALMGMLVFNLLRLLGDECLKHCALEKRANAAHGKGTICSKYSVEDLDFEEQMHKEEAKRKASTYDFKSSKELCGDAYSGKTLVKRPQSFFLLGTVIERVIKTPACISTSGGSDYITMDASIAWSEAIAACWTLFVVHVRPLKMEPNLENDETKYEAPKQLKEKPKKTGQKKKNRPSQQFGSSEEKTFSAETKTTAHSSTTKTVETSTYRETTREGCKERKTKVITEIKSRKNKSKDNSTSGTITITTEEFWTPAGSQKRIAKAKKTEKKEMVEAEIARAFERARKFESVRAAQTPGKLERVA